LELKSRDWLHSLVFLQTASLRGLRQIFLRQISRPFEKNRLHPFFARNNFGGSPISDLTQLAAAAM
jgi:hypothetical protein